MYQQEGYTLTDSDHNTRALIWIFRPLSRIGVSLAMGVLFFVVLTPIAMIMRSIGQDLLRLRLEPAKASYWLPRPSDGRPQTSMKSQL
jgi:hypothetical protein